MSCAGCGHVHADRARPCACGCYGNVVSMRVWSIRGCDNPLCPECIIEGKHEVVDAAPEDLIQAEA